MSGLCLSFCARHGVNAITQVCYEIWIPNVACTDMWLASCHLLLNISIPQTHVFVLTPKIEQARWEGISNHYDHEYQFNITTIQNVVQKKTLRMFYMTYCMRYYKWFNNFAYSSRSRNVLLDTKILALCYGAKWVQRPQGKSPVRHEIGSWIYWLHMMGNWA